MKLLAGSIVILVFLDGLHSAPLINHEDKNGYHRGRHSSKRWERHFGVGLNLGFEAGLENGMPRVQSNNHLGFDVGGYDDRNSEEFYYPSRFNSGYQYYGSPYGMYDPSPDYPQDYSQPPMQYPYEAGPNMQEINEEDQYK